MDAFSQILSGLQLAGAVFFSAEFSAPWGLSTPVAKAMAIDLAPHGVRVNTLCPTFIETPMTKPFFENAAFKESVLAKIKLGRLGTVEDLMGAIVFLAGDASSLGVIHVRSSALCALTDRFAACR